MRRRAAVSLVAACAWACAATPVAGADELRWRLEQPPPPEADQPYAVPLGAVGDIQFAAPNRGLMTTAGTSVVPTGLYTYDGRGWRPLATVCGSADARFARVAFAGPQEFWTIADPAEEARATDEGTTLCHFKDGVVVASYAVPPESADAYSPLNAAACLSPSDCWFGGSFRESPNGARRGAFHLRWDGTSVSTVYAPQGRGVTDLIASEDRYYESVSEGKGIAGSQVPAELTLTEPEPVPRLLHTITGGVFANDPFEPTPREDTPSTARLDMLALDETLNEVWAVGASPASASQTVRRRPIIVRRDAAGGTFRELELPASLVSNRDRFVDVAVVPGAASAWVAVQSGVVETSPARLLLVAFNGAVIEDVELPGADAPPLGGASKLACAGPRDCWMVTANGWLYHWSDGTQLEQDSSPAYGSLIAARPPDGRTPQPQNDTPPADNSEIFKPQPDPPLPTPPGKPEKVILPALYTDVRTKLKGERTLLISFTLSQKARIQVLGSLRGKVVARSSRRVLKRGRRSVALLLPKNTKMWPKKIDFKATRLGKPPKSTGGDDDESVVTTR